MKQPIASELPPRDVLVPPTGVEWIIDAHGCDEHRLRDASRLMQICQDVIADLGLQVVGQPQVHVFPTPGGVTAMYLLSESHLTLHTYPEYGTATFNLYCCRKRAAWSWQRELSNRLSATQVSIQSLERGRLSASLATQQGNP